MPDVLQLPAHVANQIAAGEVVERPVAVVKELVENSLDAGATKVEVVFRAGGKRLIRVTDDGHGMTPENARRALQRHATSKLRDAKDLDRILSFGFRGEALPSIASVSRFTLRTRPPETEAGIELRVDAQGHTQETAVGMPPGTSVEVAQLFAPVPARRKFLKTDRTEAAHIVHLCRLLAVAHPEVAFSLVENDRLVFQSPGNVSLRARVGEVFGRRMAEDLLPLDASEAGYRLHGLIGPPGMGRTTKAELVTFVNERPVESRLLSYALIEAYHAYVPKGRFPAAFVFLELPPAAVDVNVHPAKREVRFRDEPFVRRFVMERVLDALQGRANAECKMQNAEKGAEDREGVGLKAPPVEETDDDVGRKQVGTLVPKRPPQDASHGSGSAERGEQLAELTSSQTVEKLSARVVPTETENAVRSDPLGGSADMGQASTPSPGKPASSPDTGHRSPKHEPVAPVPGWTFLAVVHERIALFASPEGTVYLHVRAAWERIWHARIRAQLEGGPRAQQALLFAVPLEMDTLSSRVLEEHLDWFQELGFAVEPFGRHFFRLVATPNWFEPEEAGEFVRDLVLRLRERGLRPDRPDAARETIAQEAARRAARQAIMPTAKTAPELLAELFATENPLADPRGRPILTEVRRREIEKKLGLAE